MTTALQPTVNGHDSPAGADTAATTTIVEYDAITSPGPFEGPEKLLEVWFAPSADELPERGDLAASFIEREDAGAGMGNGNGESSRRQRIRHEGMKDGHDYRGLRKVPREVWEEMLDIVKCKVLSVVQGDELDAYLLR